MPKTKAETKAIQAFFLQNGWRATLSEYKLSPKQGSEIIDAALRAKRKEAEKTAKKAERLEKKAEKKAAKAASKGAESPEKAPKKRAKAPKADAKPKAEKKPKAAKAEKKPKAAKKAKPAKRGIVKLVDDPNAPPTPPAAEDPAGILAWMLMFRTACGYDATVENAIAALAGQVLDDQKRAA